MEEFLEHIDLLLSASGYLIIKDVQSNIKEFAKSTIYFIHARGSYGE